jgi:hypothetical protein
VNRHTRHIDGTQDTPDRPATYAIYVPPKLSAEAAVNARFSYEDSRRIAQSLRAGPGFGPQNSLFGHFFVGVPARFLIFRNSFLGLSFRDRDPLKQCQIVPNSAISTVLYISHPLRRRHSHRLRHV